MDSWSSRKFGISEAQLLESCKKKAKIVFSGKIKDSITYEDQSIADLKLILKMRLKATWKFE